MQAVKCTKMSAVLQKYLCGRIDSHSRKKSFRGECSPRTKSYVKSSRKKSWYVCLLQRHSRTQLGLLLVDMSMHQQGREARNKEGHTGSVPGLKETEKSAKISVVLQRYTRTQLAPSLWTGLFRSQEEKPWGKNDAQNQFLDWSKQRQIQGGVLCCRDTAELSKHCPLSAGLHTSNAEKPTAKNAAQNQILGLSNQRKFQRCLLCWKNTAELSGLHPLWEGQLSPKEEEPSGECHLGSSIRTENA